MGDVPCVEQNPIREHSIKNITIFAIFFKVVFHVLTKLVEVVVVFIVDVDVVCSLNTVFRMWKMHPCLSFLYRGTLQTITCTWQNGACQLRRTMKGRGTPSSRIVTAILDLYLEIWYVTNIVRFLELHTLTKKSNKYFTHLKVIKDLCVCVFFVCTFLLQNVLSNRAEL